MLNFWSITQSAITHNLFWSSTILLYTFFLTKEKYNSGNTFDTQVHKTKYTIRGTFHILTAFIALYNIETIENVLYVTLKSIHMLNLLELTECSSKHFKLKKIYVCRFCSILFNNWFCANIHEFSLFTYKNNCWFVTLRESRIDFIRYSTPPPPLRISQN